MKPKTKPAKGYFLSPDGHRITGTLERVFACAPVSVVTRCADGSFDLDYVGAVVAFWEEMQTVTQRGRRLYVDTKGQEWPENKLTFHAGA